MLGKQQVRNKKSGNVSWHYPVDARELVETGEYEIASEVETASEAVTKQIRTTTGAPIRDSGDPVTKDERSEQLEKLSAAEVRGIAETHGIEHKNKTDSIAAILEKEFGE